MFYQLIAPSFDFVKKNLAIIFAAIVFGFALSFIYYLTVFSLKKLKRSASPYYPFDIFFPSSGKWSVGYFLLIITALGVLIFFLLKGKFYLGPA